MNSWQPFPVAALPEPVRSYIEAAAQAIGCDASYVALPLVTACGSLIGNSRRLEIKPGWYAPPILWTAIVGESGTAKSPAMNAAIGPVHVLQKQAFSDHEKAQAIYETEKLAYEKKLTEWKRGKNVTDSPIPPAVPACQRYVVSDCTVEALAVRLQDAPRGLLLARDELSGWFGSFDRYAAKSKGGDVAHWLSMYSGGPLVVDRKASMPGQPRTIYVPRAAVSITGGIQHGILARALAPEHRESGLAARFLFTYPPRKAKRWNEGGISSDAEQELSIHYESLRKQLEPEIDLEGNPKPRLIRFSKEAKGVWIDWFTRHNQKQVDLTGDLAAAGSKLEEIPARLALILHFIEWSYGKRSDKADLSAETLESAIWLTEWFAHEAERIYSMLATAPEDAERRRLIDWIRSKGSRVTVRQVQQGCRWLRGPGLAEAKLNDLVDEGYGGWIMEETNGRPATWFELFSERYLPVNASTCLQKSQKHRENRPSVDVDNVDTLKNDDTWIDDGPPLDYLERLAGDALADDEGGME